MLLGRTLFTVVMELLVLSIAAIFETNIMKICKVSSWYGLAQEVKWEKLRPNHLGQDAFFPSYPLKFLD